ncbi:MAG: ABC transporter substrate-binding protein [Magnetococcales bacterium]|nr:ABC transporter substrate-binding protein [Magnetococcales bacterium]
MNLAWGRSLLGVVCGLVLLLAFSAGAEEASLLRITVSVPGPRNISYLPVDLIPLIGADKAEGARVQLLHQGGGGQALKQLAQRNSDFAVAGVPAHLSMVANGGEVVTLAAVDDAPLFVLMVRSALREKITKVGDLKGRIIGVNTSSLTSKTTSQQLAELILRQNGVMPEEFRILSAGQSWEDQSTLIQTGGVDAIMGDEPFASRLLQKGEVFFLINLADRQQAKGIPGGRFLHAALATRPDVLRHSPELAARMVAIMKRSLAWVASHSPEQIVDALGVTDPAERDSFLTVLRRYPDLFSKDGHFSRSQLNETDTFFHASNPEDAKALAINMNLLVDDRWVGSRD